MRAHRSQLKLRLFSCAEIAVGPCNLDDSDTIAQANKRHDEARMHPEFARLLHDPPLGGRVVWPGERLAPSEGIRTALDMQGRRILEEIFVFEIALAPARRARQIQRSVLQALPGSGQLDEGPVVEAQPGRKPDELVPHLIGA